MLSDMTRQQISPQTTSETIEPVLIVTGDEFPACRVCGQTWRAFVLAHPNARCAMPVNPPTATRSTYEQTGPTQPLTQLADDGSVFVRYTEWQCGDHTMTVVRPASDIVPCTPGGVPCHVRANIINPPSDLYINPRHGMPCECCGHQGSHVVRRDGANTPACQS